MTYRPWGSNFSPCRTGLKIRNQGAASAPYPEIHCHDAALLAGSWSTRLSENHSLPLLQSISRFFTRKLATIIRMRLGKNPSRRSCRIPASTRGIPVRPFCQANRDDLSSRQEISGRSFKSGCVARSGWCQSKWAENSLQPSSLRNFSRSPSGAVDCWIVHQTERMLISPFARWGERRDEASSSRKSLRTA